MSTSRIRKADEYESDDGFVEDAPRSKKPKKEPQFSKSKSVSGNKQVDDDGNEYWEISGKRRVNISEYNKVTMVNVREYYEKDGKTLPGKKGISLTIEQYTALLDILPDLEDALSAKGITVPRPAYTSTAIIKAEDEDGAEEEGEDEDETKPPAAANKLSKYKHQNHEATSDEDEDR